VLSEAESREGREDRSVNLVCLSNKTYSFLLGELESKLRYLLVSAARRSLNPNVLPVTPGWMGPWKSRRECLVALRPAIVCLAHHTQRLLRRYQTAHADVDVQRCGKVAVLTALRCLTLILANAHEYSALIADRPSSPNSDSLRNIIGVRIL